MIRFTRASAPADRSGGDAPDQTAARNFAHLKETIVRDYDRLGETDTFRFACHPDVPCFNRCCSDVNIFLTPYDVLRLKNRLRITSGEFLERHTVIPVHAGQKHPVVLLRMGDDEAKTCPFVDAAAGCTVYEDRPWACRMFPVGKASPGETGGEPFYFLMNEEVCRGWEQDTKWTVRGWMEDQHVRRWDEEGERYKAITLHPFFDSHSLTPPQMEMFHLACYDLDRFRRFVFGSSLLRRIVVDEKRVRRMRTSDAHLLGFGYDWLRFSLFHEPVFPVRRDSG